MNEQTGKKKLLIAVHKMDFGGVQKSLLSALHVLDYDTFDVTLYVRKAKCELLEQVDRRVNKIVINKDKTHYYRKPRAVWLYFVLVLLRILHKDTKKTQTKLSRYVTAQKMRYEKKHYFSDGTTYDIAVSYIQGNTAQFVADHVSANIKIVFFHVSTDETHALHERIFTKFDRIVAVNAVCRDILQALYPAYADKMTYIENYVNAEEVRAAAREYNVGREGKPLVLCTCGRFAPVKGFDLAVRTATILKNETLDFIWYFVGDGPERDALDSAINAAGIGGQIRITGLLENPYPYIAGCDIYVQPSYEEAHPLAILEAMILKRPVVSTATAGGKATVRNGETGMLAEITAASVAEKICALYKDRAQCARITENLGKRDWSAEKERYRTQWNSLIKEG